MRTLARRTNLKRFAFFIIIAGMLLAGCGSKPECSNPAQCVFIGSNEPITIAVILTLTGPDSLYGIDALRGVELAIADRGLLLGHPIHLVEEDDTCSMEGGEKAAERIVKNTQIVGVVGATCSRSSEAAAQTLTNAGIVLISPSSAAPALTSDVGHQPGFLRTIGNDEGQAKTVAEFAYKGLGARTMATIQYTQSYPDDLHNKACAIFKGLGGQCVASYNIEQGMSPQGALTHIALFKPEVLYYPLNITDGAEVTSLAAASGLENTALIGSDRLLNASFIFETRGFSEGMYVSGPALPDIDSTVFTGYTTRYGEEPIAVYSAQAYDAAMMLFDAIIKSAKTTSRGIVIPRGDLLESVYATRAYQGMSGILTCSPLGDCAIPNHFIYQVRGLDFFPVYP